jgi:hypothetical protein
LDPLPLSTTLTAEEYVFFSAVPDEERMSLIKVMAWDCFMQDVHCQKSQVKNLETLKGQHCPEEFCGFFTRNVFVQGQEVIILSGYSKTFHIADRDLCTPTFIHSKLGRWMVEFLAGGLRHAESLLTYVTYRQKAQHEYNM